MGLRRLRGGFWRLLMEGANVAERLPISQWTNCRRKRLGFSTESSNRYRRDAHNSKAVSHWYGHLI
jgi:hypothetical protein